MVNATLYHATDCKFRCSKIQQVKCLCFVYVFVTGVIQQLQSKIDTNRFSGILPKACKHVDVKISSVAVRQ